MYVSSPISSCAVTSDTLLETIFVTYLRYFRRRLCFIQHTKYMLSARDCSSQLLMQLTDLGSPDGKSHWPVSNAVVVDMTFVLKSILTTRILHIVPLVRNIFV
jgi:hypothetical protein